MPLFLALVADVAHAVQEGQLVALCGARVTSTTTLSFPGGARAVCRECSRGSAASASTLPVFGAGRRKRPGGM